jgi:DNA polymerase-1
VLLDQYDMLFPEIKRFMDDTVGRARMDGFVRTCYGDRISVDCDAAYRAVNYVIQGSAAQLLKRSMLRTAKWFREAGVDGHLLMPIHDELVFEIKQTDFTRKNVRKVCELMEETDGFLRIHMKVEPAMATESWETKHKVKLGR